MLYKKQPQALKAASERFIIFAKWINAFIYDQNEQETNLMISD